MRVLVVGSTGGSGRAAIQHLLVAGYEVTAFSRGANPTEERFERLHFVQGDVTNPADVERAVAGQDAVVVTLGISENPLRVRLLGPARTPLDVRSAGTRNVISAMRKHGVSRLVVQTSFGVGETRKRLGWVDALFLRVDPEAPDRGYRKTEPRGFRERARMGDRSARSSDRRRRGCDAIRLDGRRNRQDASVAQ